jgi:transcriptional regulator with XRE-family HTH domain
MSLVPTQGFERAVARATTNANAAFGLDTVRLREDAGVTRAQLARAAGINDSYLFRIERGLAEPSIGTCVRLALALGADLAHRLYPTTGSTIRDRHQAPIAEEILGILSPRWRPFLEIAVRRPSRGWVDLGLHAPHESVFVATEIQSDLRRLEQLLRWSEEKAASLPSWEGFAHLGSPSISRLLVVRETRANRATAREFQRVLRTAYPAHGDDAIESLTRDAPWPGPTLLWAARDRTRPSAYRIVSRP